MDSIMTRRCAVFAAPFFASVVLLGAVACHKDADPPPNNGGTFERAGRAVDNTAGEVKDDTKKGANDVKNGASSAADRAGDDFNDGKDTVKRKWKDSGL